MRKILTLARISTLFESAYMQTATVSAAINRFQKTRTSPIYKNVITDVDFLSASTADIESFDEDLLPRYRFNC